MDSETADMFDDVAIGKWMDSETADMFDDVVIGK